MRVQLDNGRKSIDIDISDNFDESFLATVRKALVAMDYTETDLLREWSTKEDEE